MNFEVLSHGDETIPGAEPQVNQLREATEQRQLFQSTQRKFQLVQTYITVMLSIPVTPH